MESPESSATDGSQADPRPRILMIAGWGRSGSTILANVLGSAPGVVTLGEINNIWQRGFGDDLQCSCGAPFSVCALWQAVANRAFAEPFSTVAEAASEAAEGLGNTWLIRRRIPGWRKREADRADGYAAMLRRLYSAAAETTGARLLVDASKSPWHCAVASELEGFDVYVLHLIRDPRGVAHSLRKKVGYQQGGEHIYMDRHGPSASSLAWVYRNRLVEWEWRNDPNYLQMRYEDFVADPQARLTEILQLVGLGEAMPSFAGSHEVEVSPSHNISGNPVRFQKGTVKLRADDAWRESLPKWIRAYIRLITWPHMRHFRYR